MDSSGTFSKYNIIESLYLLLHNVSILTRYSTYAGKFTHRQAFKVTVLTESLRAADIS
jgi:hypothetical protein